MTLLFLVLTTTAFRLNFLNVRWVGNTIIYTALVFSIGNVLMEIQCR